MQDLTVTIIQTEVAWEDIPANLQAFEGKINGIPEETDLIILPEMFSTGFTMNAARLAEEMQGPAATWICAMSRERGAHIIGSVIILEAGRYYNRLLWARPDGGLLTYDKRHLFRMADEHLIYSPGNTHLTVNIKGWNLRPFICYDMRFPIWTRNIGNEYDVAIFIANWPSPRAAQWRLLMPARAVENQAYVIGVNRVGKDGNGLSYSGDSSIVDPLGNVLFHQPETPCIHTERLSYDRVSEYRETFAAWRDADGDLVSFPDKH